MRPNAAAALGTRPLGGLHHARHQPDVIARRSTAARTRAVPAPPGELPAVLAAPGRPCTVTGPAGDHLARWQRAERRGLIGREDLAAVVAGLEVIAAHVIIRDGAR